MQTAAQDFTIFADDAYAVHHLTEESHQPLNLLKACQDAGNPDRVYIFGSTSKITFAGAGIGFMGCSGENVSYIDHLMSRQFITPNKIEQYRHVKFLNQYKGGIAGIMRDHAKLLAPKFKAVDNVLKQELADSDLARWTTPRGGYFISLDTSKPVASKVVELAREVGVALTPAGATFPHGKDPNNSNIRIAPTRPPVKEVELAMRIVALCIKIASID
jgi:DNA-binding transcriptional MocR family regulator